MGVGFLLGFVVGSTITILSIMYHNYKYDLDLYEDIDIDELFEEDQDDNGKML